MQSSLCSVVREKSPAPEVGRFRLSSRGSTGVLFPMHTSPTCWPPRASAVCRCTPNTSFHTPIPPPRFKTWGGSPAAGGSHPRRRSPPRLKRFWPVPCPKMIPPPPAPCRRTFLHPICPQTQETRFPMRRELYRPALALLAAALHRLANRISPVPSRQVVVWCGEGGVLQGLEVDGEAVPLPPLQAGDRSGRGGGWRR